MKRYRRRAVLILAVMMLLPVWVVSAHAREATPLRLTRWEPEPMIEGLKVQRRQRLGGEFGAALRQNFSSQLGVIGWRRQATQ